VIEIIIVVAIMIAVYLWFKTDKQVNNDDIRGGETNGIFLLPQIFLIFIIVSGLIIYGETILDESMKDSPTYDLVKVSIFGIFIIYGFYSIIKDKINKN